MLGIHCELCRLVHSHTGLLQSRPTCLHLMGGHPVLRAQSAGPLRPSHPAAHALYPVWMEILGCIADVSHEGLRRMSSLLHSTCTAYSPASCGQ